MSVTKGQTYRAKARRGFRLFKIDQVRGMSTMTPYALVHEVLPSGKRATGTSWTGLQRGVQFSVYLRRVERELLMPSDYEMEES